MDNSAYLSQLIGLLPPGDALAREPGSVLERLLSVPAAELARVDGRVEALLTESDPARTTEMLADWERALGLPDVCYPNFAFSRASTAWYFDGAGTLREAAVDQPRYLYDDVGQQTDAVLVEAAGVNAFTNPWLLGAVPGTPGTMPGNTNTYFLNGLAREIVGSGMEDGIPYFDLRFFGTATGGVFSRFGLGGHLTGLDISNNAQSTFSAFCRLVGGSLEAISTCRIGIQGRNAAGSVVQGLSGLSNFRPTAGPLRDQLTSVTWTPPDLNVVRGEWFLDILRGGTATVDITLRIGAPQHELGPVATSRIFPPVGTQAASTRAADHLFIATEEERRARILARFIERFEPTPAAIIGLAARLGDSVTLTEFRPHTCEDSCEAPVLDDAWAHAFQVAGASQMVVEFTCLDTCETPLSQWRTGAYECAIRRFAPAQAVPIFSYA
jgi:uncharacterized protein YmfQ (DUF2313 family)